MCACMIRSIPCCPCRPVRTLDVSQVPVQWDQDLAKQAEGLMVDVALYDDHMQKGMSLKVWRSFMMPLFTTVFVQWH